MPGIEALTASAAKADTCAADDPDEQRNGMPPVEALDNDAEPGPSALGAARSDVPAEQPLSLRVRFARESADLSKSELARRVGVCLSAAVQWELAKGTSPTVANLVRIARATEVAFEWLATGRGSPILADELLGADESGVNITFEKRLLKAVRNVPDARRNLVIEFALAIIEAD